MPQATRLVVVENTQSLCGGQPIDAAYMADLGALCKAKVRVHGR